MFYHERNTVVGFIISLLLALSNTSWWCGGGVFKNLYIFCFCGEKKLPSSCSRVFYFNSTKKWRKVLKLIHYNLLILAIIYIFDDFSKFSLPPIYLKNHQIVPIFELSSFQVPENLISGTESVTKRDLPALKNSWNIKYK